MIEQETPPTAFERFRRWTSPLRRRIDEVRAGSFTPDSMRTRQVYQWVVLFFSIFASFFSFWGTVAQVPIFGDLHTENLLAQAFQWVAVAFMLGFLGLLYLHKVAPKKIVGDSEAFPYYPKVFPTEFRTYKLQDSDGNVKFLTLAMERLGTLLGGAWAGDGPLAMVAIKGGRINERVILELVRYFQVHDDAEVKLPEVRQLLEHWRIRSYDEILLDEYEKTGKEPLGRKLVEKTVEGSRVVSWSVPQDIADKLSFDFDIGHYSVVPGSTIIRVKGDAHDGIDWLRPWISNSHKDLSPLATILLDLDPLPAVKDLDRIAPHQQRTNVEWLIANLEWKFSELQKENLELAMHKSEIALGLLPGKMIDQEF